METTTNFKYRVAQVLSGDFRQDDIVPVCTTPEIVRSVGFSDSQIVMTQRHIRNCLATEETATPQDNHHDLPIDFMDNLPAYIENPAMVLSSMSQPDSVVVVTDCKDKKDRPIIIALKNAGTGTVGGKVITCNVVTSTYGKDSFCNFLNKSLQNNGLLFCDIKKSRDLVVSAGLQLPGLLAKYDSNSIIRKYDENVNTFKQKFLLNPKNYVPEQYGQTLYRPDGLPIAYADVDGRQRQYEYGKSAGGALYIAKTTATFSDGRSEVTEYDAHGSMTSLTRFAADGRDTYSYSSDDYGLRKSERHVMYDESRRDDYFARKSVHEKTRSTKEERGVYYDSTNESWEDFDERDNLILSKNNVYGNGDKLTRADEVKFAYDSYGNVVSRIDKDGSVTKTEYYPPSKVRDYFGYDIDAYDAGAIDYNVVKCATSRYADGSIRIKSFTLDGKSTQLDYSPDGKLTAFRAENGDVFMGKAAENAYMRSCGQTPVASKSLTARSNNSSAAPSKTPKNARSDNGKSGGRRGSSGAGR